MALRGPTSRPLFRVGVQEKAKIRVGKDDRTDIPTFHDQPFEAPGLGDFDLTALVSEEGGTEFRHRGEVGNTGVHLRRADFLPEAAPPSMATMVKVGSVTRRRILS